MARNRLPKPKKCFAIPIYGGTVCYYTDRKTYSAALAFCRGEPLRTECVGHFVAAMNEVGEVLYLVGAFDKVRSTIVHEVGHLTFSILERAGMDPRDSGGEAFCYLQDTIVDHLGINK